MAWAILEDLDAIALSVRNHCECFATSRASAPAVSLRRSTFGNLNGGTSIMFFPFVAAFKSRIRRQVTK